QGKRTCGESLRGFQGGPQGTGQRQQAITENMAVEPKLQPPVLDGASLAPFTLRDLLVYFLRLGTLGFGGPIALAGYMQRDLVEGRRWVSKQDYLEGLVVSQLSPG